MAQLETYEILLVRAGKLEDMGSARRVLPHQLPVERGMGSVARYLLTWVTFSKVASPGKMIRSYWISWCTSYRHESGSCHDRESETYILNSARLPALPA